MRYSQEDALKKTSHAERNFKTLKESNQTFTQQPHLGSFKLDERGYFEMVENTEPFAVESAKAEEEPKFAPSSSATEQPSFRHSGQQRVSTKRIFD
jgi:hypothetical protein